MDIPTPSVTDGPPYHIPQSTNSTNSVLLDSMVRELRDTLNSEIPSILSIPITTSTQDTNEPSLYSNIITMLNTQLRDRIQNRASTTSRVMHLTNEQICISTRIIKYSTEFNEQRCPISLDEFVVDENICQIKQCSHIFKNNSLMNWLRSNSHCPVCRYDLITYVEPTVDEPSVQVVTEPEIIYDVVVEEEPAWLDNDDIAESDHEPHNNTSASSRIVDNIYNLVSSGLNELPVNQTNNTITQINNLFQQYKIPTIPQNNIRNILQSTLNITNQIREIREHSNNTSTTPRTTTPRTRSTSMDERLPEQPDVD